MDGHVLGHQNAFYTSSKSKQSKMTQPTRSGRVPTKEVPWEEREILPLSIITRKSREDEVQILETRAPTRSWSGRECAQLPKLLSIACGSWEREVGVCADFTLARG